jgi:heptosyltransferase-1
LGKQAQFRLLVVRLGAMGDVLHALPAITALRRAHPAWHIAWAIEPQWAPLLTAEPLDFGLAEERSPTQPLVDRIHLVPAKAWGKKPFSSETWAEIRAMRAELHAGEYDAVLDVQGAIRSAIVSRLAGCHRIIGESSPREALARWLFTERIRTVGNHVIEQDAELASAVSGDLLTPTIPLLPTNEDAEEWADRLPSLVQASVIGRPVVLIHPGGGWGAKRWPAARYGAVAEEFGSRGALVFINAGPGEDALAAEVLVASEDQATIVRCTLDQLIALTRRATLVIGGDTGPLHLACALGKPVVGIYGPTDPKRNGPYGNPFRVLRNPESRRDHTRRDQPEAGLLTIWPEAVIASAADLLLEERKNRQSSGRPAEWSRR